MGKFFTGFSIALLVLVGTNSGSVPATALEAMSEDFKVTFQNSDVSELVNSAENLESSQEIVANYLASRDRNHFLNNLDSKEILLLKGALQIEESFSTFSVDEMVLPRISTLAVVAPSCYSGTATRWAENAFGGILWKMSIKGTWCGLFDTVSSPKVVGVYPISTGYLWVAGGLLDKGASIVSNTARIYGQYQFNLNLAGWNAQSSYPCLRIRGLVSGSYSASNSCGPF
jgi:hypothetical protein